MKFVLFFVTLYVFVFLFNIVHKYAKEWKWNIKLYDMNLTTILLNVPAVTDQLTNGEKLTEALLLMAIGMLTVFAVLLIIILLGNLLIKSINKFFPEEVKPVMQPVQAVDQQVQEAINKAILAISGGKKSAQSIEKL